MKPKYEVDHISIVETVDEVKAPPPDLKTTFKTLQDWLVNVCDSEKPKIAVEMYDIGVFESEKNYVVFLVGRNKYDNYDKIDFQPTNMYYMLPRVEYRGLSREQLMNRLTDELKEFTKSKKFQRSYLAQADSIKLSGKTLIWSK